MSALIETHALTRRDERRQTLLLQPTDFSLNRADRVSITGSSGSGKSVFLRALALLDAPTSGQVLWNGQPIANTEIPHYRSHISYLSQRPALIEGTVEDNLRFPFSLKTLRQRRFDLAAVTALLEHAGKTQEFLGKNAADLSGGEAQVASLIRTLQLNPEVLLLDEPTAALDPTSSRDVEALINAWFAADNARAYIWVSHDLEQARRMSEIHLQMSAGVLSGAARP
ncbi:ABC transporter ATP-binding protein [Pseudomonas haemolytica]|uniref:ATP-binding cassette domain-containing protein n=1 Tax=Pseudomonas haemolytica TaxID=2600065 RepID=A0A5P1D8W7_9PSED|nr:ATP-binding cassette domain-containing protein [Pseudomonas haemolytica]MBJ2245117.1 ATP-binding cassette domain-containing protein [Pseudomonas haemolytica]MBJ2272453.1 ATP-binding cassette domain-containing protein [Pseudomonas haemolytica]MBK3446790.1 ATP-binding cassette domain-containing protein [Pseudomonas haemolytica]MBK3458285.1 ATP-binding cassette domain-containing protein [Pseudomonas haemolytica]MRJ36923.1 ATP-binding cassette domain-containing protein [Pseudomonas haemolytica]